MKPETCEVVDMGRQNSMWPGPEKEETNPTFLEAQLPPGKMAELNTFIL